MTRWLVLLPLLLALSACKEKQDTELEYLRRDQSHIAEVIAKSSAAKLTLFSINPHDIQKASGQPSESSNGVFHHYPILGSIEIVSLDDKKALLEAFAKGVSESDGKMKRCFDPRHGLRIATESATNDFAICFECLSVKAYGFSLSPNFLTTHSPLALFDQFLDKNRINKAD